MLYIIRKSVVKRQKSQTTSDYKDFEPVYKWLRVTASDYESDYESGYEWLRVITSDYQSIAKHCWISND